ncbi:MAG: 23S rRNA (pseudouridine(1915)-N(3))-methyltransferase RlmH [bacterium]|nr:23S rRNA (pseudouridine(1915)-N(3))-methyltransferase RlmH [bacterium]
MKLTVISVGKKHNKLLAGAIADFEKRLRAPFNFEWRFLTSSIFEGEKARIEESERLEKLLSNDDFVILLDERGRNFSSPELAEILTHNLSQKNVKIVIGGAFGVSDNFRSRANLVWSLSKLVFPHQIVRLVLAEQIYRAQEISRGGKYHHE